MNYLKNLFSNYKFDPSKFYLGMRTFKTGMGADAFSVVPGSFNLAGLSAPNREYNVSIQLQEVYPWL